jgi:hypothetical protein
VHAAPPAPPSPEQLLVARIHASAARMPARGADPIVAALGFSAAMTSVAR